MSRQITKSLLIAGVVTLVVTTLILRSTYTDIKTSVKLTTKKIDSISQRSLEKAYFEGQRDFMNGDVRIFRQINDNDTTYTILRSFWNNGDSMIFKP